MSTLKDIYQVKTMEELADVAALCSGEEFETMMRDLEVALCGFRFCKSFGTFESARLESFNWSPLPEFPYHLVDDDKGKGLWW